MKILMILDPWAQKIFKSALSFIPDLEIIEGECPKEVLESGHDLTNIGLVVTRYYIFENHRYDMAALLFLSHEPLAVILTDFDEYKGSSLRKRRGIIPVDLCGGEEAVKNAVCLAITSIKKSGEKATEPNVTFQHKD